MKKKFKIEKFLFFIYPFLKKKIVKSSLIIKKKERMNKDGLLKQSKSGEVVVILNFLKKKHFIN